MTFHHQNAKINRRKNKYYLVGFKAPDKQHICIFTHLKQREYAIKLICVRTKTQTKFVGTQCKKFQKRNIRIPSVYATTAVSNCKQLSGTNSGEKTDKI